MLFAEGIESANNFLFISITFQTEIISDEKSEILPEFKPEF